MSWKRKFFAAQGLGLGVFLFCQGLAWLLPGLKAAFFCRPAATLGALFLRVPVAETSRGFQVMHERYDVFVVESCSGFDFFALLLAVFFAMAIHFSERRWRRWVMWGAVAYAITVGANTARIVCSVQARVYSDAMPISLPADAIHFAVGTAIFATVLVISCHLARIIHESHARRSAS